MPFAIFLPNFACFISVLFLLSFASRSRLVWVMNVSLISGHSQLMHVADPMHGADHKNRGRIDYQETKIRYTEIIECRSVAMCFLHTTIFASDVDNVVVVVVSIALEMLVVGNNNPIQLINIGMHTNCYTHTRERQKLKNHDWWSQCRYDLFRLVRVYDSSSSSKCTQVIQIASEFIPL